MRFGKRHCVGGNGESQRATRMPKGDAQKASGRREDQANTQTEKIPDYFRDHLGGRARRRGGRERDKNFRIYDPLA